MGKGVKIIVFLGILVFLQQLFPIEMYTPRGRSIGDSFVSYSMDAESLVYNPALSSRLNSTQLILEYEDLLPGIRKDLSLNRHLIGIVFPLEISNNKYCFGASIYQFESEIYKENIYSAVVSKDITSLVIKDIAKLDEIKIALGIRAKYLNISYPISNLLSEDPLFDYSREKSAFSLDLGISYIVRDTYYYGLLVNDIFEPNVGLKETSYWKRKIVLGFAYKYLLTDKNIVLIPSLGIRSFFNRTDLSLGCEVNFKGNYFIRATYSNWNTAFGLGYNYKDILQIDYSYIILSELDTIGGHYVSLSYRISRNAKQISTKEKIEDKQQKNVSVEKKTIDEKKTTDTKTTLDKKSTSPQQSTGLKETKTK